VLAPSQSSFPQPLAGRTLCRSASGAIENSIFCSQLDSSTIQSEINLKCLRYGVLNRPLVLSYNISFATQNMRDWYSGLSLRENNQSTSFTDSRCLVRLFFLYASLSLALTVHLVSNFNGDQVRPLGTWIMGSIKQSVLEKTSGQFVGDVNKFESLPFIGRNIGLLEALPR